MRKSLLVALLAALIAVLVYSRMHPDALLDFGESLRAFASKITNGRISAPDALSEPVKNEPERQKFFPVTPQNITEIPVNTTVNFDHKSRREIYEIRKGFVEQSLFKGQNYEPAEAVLGQIEDGYPWITLGYTFRTFFNGKRDGDSEESRFINNPSALVMFNFVRVNIQTKFEAGDNLYLLPESIRYYKDENTVKITYNFQEFFDSIPDEDKGESLFQLEGLNARDFGFQWAYVYQSKNVYFAENTVNYGVRRFKNFIHLGMSTGIPRNNGSPRQPEFDFKINELPAYIKLKLWRKKPESENDEADIKAELHFNKSENSVRTCGNQKMLNDIDAYIDTAKFDEKYGNNKVDMYILKARILDDLGKYEYAVKTLRSIESEYVQEGQKNIDFYVLLGFSYEESEDIENAKKCYVKAAQAGSKYAQERLTELERR
ncbi:MAG: hypothetical protein FWC57_02650 [Endomicrobia bacterium]|nr:hypothetical protein [Endomicrobiia bacterium]